MKVVAKNSVRGHRPERDGGLEYQVTLSVEDFFLTGAFDGGVVYRRKDSKDGRVTLSTFSQRDALLWKTRLGSLGCEFTFAAVQVARFDYAVRARDPLTRKMSIYVVRGVPGSGADHEVAVLFVEAKTGLKGVSSRRMEGIQDDAVRYVKSPFNSALLPDRHTEIQFEEI